MKTLVSANTRILVFKTDIRYEKDLDAVEKALTFLPGILSWNVDRHDAENILRIESPTSTPADIIAAMNQGGFICIELED